MKKSRFALFQSVIALLLCVSMLAGTTFAWFTDSVSSGTNTIAAGNLDIELEYRDANGTWHEVDESTAVLNNEAKWEPGHTEVAYLRISNAGNLALKYGFGVGVLEETGSINVNGEPFYLSEHIRFGIITSKSLVTYGTREEARDALTASQLISQGEISNDDTLKAADKERYVTLVVYMPEEIGNVANHATGVTPPEIKLGIQLTATQAEYESDSFGKNYDSGLTPDVFDFPAKKIAVTASAGVTTDESNKVADEVTLADDKTSAKIPEGVLLDNGAKVLTLEVSTMEQSGANIVLKENEDSISLDVHVEGVSKDNTQPMEITIQEVAPKGLNMGNYKFYHVENGITNEMTLIANDAVFTEHNQYKYDPGTGNITLYMATFSEVALVADTENAWEGEFDYTWYDASKTELTIANADQLAAFGAIVGGMNGQTQNSFDGKTVKLIADVNLGDAEEKNNSTIIFYPIGYNSSDGKYEKTGVAVTTGFYNFCGIFDGNGHTISNFYHNTWEMKGDNNYYDASLQYYRDGMGLFGKVYGGTVKNLTVSNFSSDGEYTTTGVIAAYADGATFENIAIVGCNPRVYNIGNGGIVGCVGWYAKEANLKTTFKNITVDNSNKISALWGSYDVACGGIVGQYYPTSGQTSADTPKNAGVHFENCHISAQMDVYNDVCANYQYYAYRYTGMLIGSVRENVTIDGHVYPKMDGITASGCTVHFGTWNDYYYCEIIDNTTASYTHDYQMSRLTEIKAIDGTTITYLDGTTGTVPASGRANYVIVDYTKGHGTENATCYHFKDGAVWTHDMGGIQTGIDENGDGQDDLKEDKQHIYLEFNNLVTGYGWGVTTKGVDDLDGVTILDRKEGNSVEKFEGKVNELANNKVYKLGDIFNFVNNGVELVPGALTVAVTNLDEKNPVSATIVYDKDNWENGTLTLTGTGEVQITIQDYYFCTPTTIDVTVTDRQPEEKFDVVMNNGDFLHRVGNSGTVALDKLFKAKDGAGTPSVTIEAVNGSSASGIYSNNAIQFSGTGVVKVTITDNDYCIPAELYLEVVDAVNATSATSATANNVVLLNDCGFSSLEVSGGYTLYGNGFTMTCGSDSVAIDRTYSFVELKGGTLDNVKIVVPNFSHAIMYEKNKTESGNPSNTDSSGRTRYYNIRSAVLVSATSKITNSYISGGRAAVYVTSGTLTLDNSTIYGGAVANIQAEASSKLILNNMTLIQKPIKANVNDTNKTLMGLSVVSMCDTEGNGTNITLQGYLHQYAWANESYGDYVPSDAQDVITEILSKSDFVHSITYEDGESRDSVNLGFVNMPDGTTATEKVAVTDNRSTKDAMPYENTTVKVVANIYTYKNTKGTNDSVQDEPEHNVTVQSNVAPTIKYEDVNENRVLTTSYDESKAQWKASLKVDVDAGAYNFSFDKLLAQKYGKNLSYTVKSEDGTAVDKSEDITLNSAVSNVYILTITDDQIYDKNGNKLDISTEVTYIFELLSTKTSLPAPTWTSTTLNGTPYIVVDSKDGDWNCAVPVLDGLKVKYWSKKQNKEVELDLANVVSAAGLSKGLQNGSNNTITIKVDDEYTLQITTTGFKTNDNGKPVVVNGKLYFTVSSSSNYVSTKTTDRTISINYVFTDANNSEPVTLNTSFSVVYATYKSNQYKYSDFCNGTLTDAPSCITPDTLITLANGKQVRVDSLTGNEELLVWNLETGKYDTAPIVFVDNEQESEYEIIHLYFSDGSDVKVIYEHGFFDLDLGEYVYIDAYNYGDYIGHRFVTEGDIKSNNWNVVTLDEVVIETEVTTAWSPVTFEHLCYYTNGVLSMPGGIEGLFNIFEVDTDLMRYDAVKMQKDIETFGLFAIEDFGGMITEDAFNAFNGAYLKVAIAKGILTWEDIAYMAERYIPLMK